MPYSQEFEDALLYANRLHANQHRKAGNIPYITHLMSVAALVAEYGGNEDQVIAALLHDAVEDQGGPPIFDDIRERFGQKVARIVEGCTDTDVTPKPPWLERKSAYIRSLTTAPPEVLLVSAADKLHNARSVVAGLRQDGDPHFALFKGRKEGTLWYYRSLVEVFTERGSNALTDELKRTVDVMHGLAKSDST